MATHGDHGPLDLLPGSPKNKKVSINSPNGGFSIGKLNNHLKQTQVMFLEIAHHIGLGKSLERHMASSGCKTTVL